MAIMARTLGIPSRVVVGFTQGAQDEDGVWRVTVRDAHAWPELWFEGVGWARFEPTPRSGATVFTPEYARAADGDIPQGGDLSQDGIPRGAARRRGFRSRRGRPLDRAVPPPRPDRPARAAGDGAAARRCRWPAGWCVAVVACTHVGTAPSSTARGQRWATSPSTTASRGRSSARRGRRRSGCRAAWPSHRPRRCDGCARRWSRFATRPTGTGHGSMERAEAVRADVRTVQRELRDRVRWQTRVAAYCWPSSERRRQRSSMRSMKPEDAPGAAGFAGAAGASSAGRAPKAE